MRSDSSRDPADAPGPVSLDSLPLEGLSLTEAILVLAHDDAGDAAMEPDSSTGGAAGSKAGSAAGEKVPERLNNHHVTPKKSFSPGKTPAACSSVPLIHDEDSMMRTLSSLKKIPDAISPLRSPVRISKRNLSHLQGKPGHVKSLQKDFSSTPADGSLKKLDVNKENKYPRSPANRDAPNLTDKLSDLPPGLSDTDLEEGEIVSESEEATAGSPAPAAKRAKLAAPGKNRASPKPHLKRKHEERCGVSKDGHEAAVGSARSPRTRFKTVCPAATKSSFSTVGDIMETFKLVRTEIRKKYMKLHKSFPRKSFYGVMENFQESFLEFVDGARFGNICSHSPELKSKLRKLITSVFSKVSDNGIVKRIFEQQAADMKQKLWDFVDAQVNYLFAEIDSTLQGLCKPGRTNHKTSSRKEESSRQSPRNKPHRQPEAASPPMGVPPSRPCPYRTGLGSRGKDIRISHAEQEEKVDLTPPSSLAVVEFLPPKNPSTLEKSSSSSVASHHGALADKTDFQLLTEQQASSLTFNLVRDSQMGEIFKCLLQGSDLLESSGENGAWTLTSPRKDGEAFIGVATPTKSKLLTPSKLDTPTKLVAAWASISPRKLSSPRPKEPMRLNPALFDESCMLEVPSQSGVPLQKSFSILAEDLAVSLTIPSPLKSDSHLSFLQPPCAGMHLMSSTPDSVISAHIGEDALLDGEDATEQDIHLALDTDNSSPDCSSSGASSPLATPFVFKPDLPVEALVMEKSNDHFVLKIRQAGGGVVPTDEDARKDTAKEGQTSTGLFEKLHQHCRSSSSEPSDPNPSKPPGHSETRSSSSSTLEDGSSPQSVSEDSSPNQTLTNPDGDGLDTDCQSADCTIVAEESHMGEEDTSPKCPADVVSLQKTIGPSEGPDVGLNHREAAASLVSDVSASRTDETDVFQSEGRVPVTEDTGSSPQKPQTDQKTSRKRKKHQKKSKAKRSKEAESRSSSVRRDEEEPPPAPVSPSSLSAKNVVRKKGEVVVAWTRDDDRAILIALKTKGASRDTFSALSERLNKPSEQIAHRFHQLMKLFKKMDS